MKILLHSAMALLLAGSVAGADPTTFREWRFDAWNDPQGWTVPPALGGTATGGGLWLHIQRQAGPDEPLTWKQLIWSAGGPHTLVSPAQLNIDAAHATQVRLRLLNRSPETDGILAWRSAAAPDVDAGAVRFTMRPQCNDWQEVIVDMTGRWSGVIDRILVTPALLGLSGDIWLASIAITDGPSAPEKPRPVVAGPSVVPRVTLPGITQEAFADAFTVLDECLITNVPVHGFTEPVMGPGGAYGENWWQLDSSLNCDGAKWTNQAFAEGVLRGFASVQAQNPDGRIDLWGGAPSRGIPAATSSIPRLFEVAHRIARRSSDPVVHRQTCDLLRKYLDWWLSPVKRDANTGLITYVFEESFGETEETPQTIAPVDLQVAVALGCAYTADLAALTGDSAGAARYRQAFESLKAAINTYCWDEDAGAYYNFDVKTMSRRMRLLVSTFDPLRLSIAPPERVERLIAKLTDPALFNWGARPLTSIAKTEPDYVEAAGPYEPRAWRGDIWTMRNVPVIFGLRDSGHDDLAAQLAWDTVKLFNANYAEYVVPSTGKGEGVARYGWSATQYIQTVIELIFGIEYDAVNKRLTVAPLLVPELRKVPVAIEDLRLPLELDTRLDVRIGPRADGGTSVDVEVDPLPSGLTLAVVLDGKTQEVPLTSTQQILITP